MTNSNSKALLRLPALLFLLLLLLLLLIYQSYSFTTTSPSISFNFQQGYYNSLCRGYRFQFFAFSSSEDYPNFSPQDYGSGAGFHHDHDDYGDQERLSDEELMATLGEWDELKPKLNTVHLTGRVGTAPVAKYFEDGKVVVNLSLASKRKYHYLERQQEQFSKQQPQEDFQETTDWYGLEIWGQTAEYVEKYVDKGMRVGVIGSLQEDRWNDKETGEPRNNFKIIVRDFDILETRAESEARRSRSSRTPPPGAGGAGGAGGDYFSTSNDGGGPSYNGDVGGPSSSSSGAAGTGGFFDS